MVGLSRVNRSSLERTKCILLLFLGENFPKENFFHFLSLLPSLKKATPIASFHSLSIGFLERLKIREYLH